MGGAIGMGLGVAWLLGLAGALVFLTFYGSPRQYHDRTMSWHLFWTVVIGGLQYVGKLLSGWSLVPLLIADWISVGIVYWRIGLFISTRRRSSSRKMEKR